MNTISNSDISSQKARGNSAYQQRQQIRRHHLERKQTLRKIFEMGKIVEKAGFGLEDLDAIYAILVDAKEKYTGCLANERKSGIKSEYLQNQ